MPIFDFVCESCGEVIKDVVVMLGKSDVDDRIKDGKVMCPKCGGECKKVFSMNFSFRLEGDGWTPKFGK